MKLKKNLFETTETPKITTIIDILVQHFNYSIADIKSYGELTEEEKKIIPEYIFNEIAE